ncbi:MAG: M48 family metallopeptidase [Spirochaetales bacterium]|nr:M48 family metallopeptidase [Spirochaetales bacterium]
MTPSGFLALYLAFFGFEFLFETILTRLNLRAIDKNKSSVPSAFRDYVDGDMYKTSVAYSLARGRFSIAVSVIGAAVVLAVVLSGSLGVIDNLIAGIKLPPAVEGVLFVAIVAAVFHITSIPPSLYSQFVIEKRFGFSTITAKTYILDEIKSIALSTVLGIPLLLLLFWFIRSAGEYWWFFAFLAVAALQLAITVIYPVLIAPLFNKFSPLEEGNLRTKIEKLARDLNFTASGIFVMDGSRRSRHSNAYFTGFGKAKRIVLYDTLVQQLEERQVLAVLAHEIGHQKLRHILKRLPVSLLLTLLSLFLVDVLLGADPLFAAFGIQRATAHGLLVILAFCSGPFTFLLTPLFTSWSRRHEYQADKFAAESGGYAGDLKRALIKLGKDNKTNLTPHPLYSFFHYSHPALSERVAYLEELESAGG